MAVLGVSRPRHERPAADIRRRGAMGVPNTKMTVGLLPRSTDHDQRGLDHPDRPAHFYGAGAGASGPGRTMSVDVPCARIRPRASRIRPSQEMMRRPRTTTRPSARTRPVSLVIGREKFTLVSIAKPSSSMAQVDALGTAASRLVDRNCIVPIEELAPSPAPCDRSLRGLVEGTEHEKQTARAPDNIGGRRSRDLRDKFKRVRGRSRQNNKFAAWPFSPRLRPVVLHSRPRKPFRGADGGPRRAEFRPSRRTDLHWRQSARLKRVLRRIRGALGRCRPGEPPLPSDSRSSAADRGCGRVLDHSVGRRVRDSCTPATSSIWKTSRLAKGTSRSWAIQRGSWCSLADAPRPELQARASFETRFSAPRDEALGRT